MNTMLAFLLAALLPSVALAGRHLRTYDAESTIETPHRELQQQPVTNYPFIEKDGLVVMEAENVPLVGFWRKEQVFPTYTGSGYLRFDGNTILGGAVNSTLSYFIQINNPGTYVMDMRARKNNTNTGLNNDCWIRLVGHPGMWGTHTKTALQGRSFAYHSGMKVELQPSKQVILITYTFNAPGVYELHVSGRSRHFVMDRIMLYRPDMVARLDAERPTLPESPRLTNPSALQYVHLMTAGTGTSTYLRTLKDGDVISFNTVGTSLSVVVNTFGEIGSVLFECDGKSRTETSAPYQMNGGNTTDNTPAPYLATPGLKTVTITVFGKVAGTVLAKETIRFTLTAATSTPTRSPIVVVPTMPVAAPRALASLDLVKAVAPYEMLQPLVAGAVLDQATLGTKLSVIAQVSFNVTAVHFLYGGRIFRETMPVYAMVGNEDDNVYPVPYLSTTGTKTITVKAFTGPATGLVEIDSITVNFSIVANISIVANPPPVSAPVSAAPVPAAPVSAAPVSAAPVAAAPVTAAPATDAPVAK